jgi:hypothetical protein
VLLPAPGPVPGAMDKQQRRPPALSHPGGILIAWRPNSET